jgi:transcriptional regulator with XRE-family HTH domain
MNKFQEFLRDEMALRDMSLRQFAELMDVAPSTISKAMRIKDPPEPSIEFLLRLSKVTKTTFLTVLRLAYPVIDDETVIVDETLYAERLAKLSPETRSMFNAMLEVALKDVEEKTSKA